jgi:hypothetical protein
MGQAGPNILKDCGAYEVSGTTFSMIQHYIPEKLYLEQHHCVNLKCCIQERYVN